VSVDGSAVERPQIGSARKELMFEKEMATIRKVGLIDLTA